MKAWMLNCNFLKINKSLSISNLNQQLKLLLYKVWKSPLLGSSITKSQKLTVGSYFGTKMSEVRILSLRPYLKGLVIFVADPFFVPPVRVLSALPTECPACALSIFYLFVVYSGSGTGGRTPGCLWGGSGRFWCLLGRYVGVCKGNRQWVP